MPLTLRQKAENVLAIAYRGLHHVDMRRAKEEPGYFSVCVFNGVSTYDFDTLTRLVVAAHDECVRLEIDGASHRYLRLIFHDRKREGGISERHPTMEDAITYIRQHTNGNRPHQESKGEHDGQ